jgi:hypothetical protein
METTVLYLCGVWFWLTRKWRVAAYSDAARQLDIARMYLLRDFTSRASTCDRGRMLPHQIEAVALLERHAEQTLATASHFQNLLDCCRFVSGEIRQAASVSPVSPHVPLQPVPFARRIAPIRVRVVFASGRFFGVPIPTGVRLSVIRSLLRGEGSGAIWGAAGLGKLRHIQPKLTPDGYKPQIPLKAA